MGLADTAKMFAELGLRDKMSPGLSKASGNLDRFDTKLGKVGGGLGKASAGIARAGTIIAGAAATGLAGAAKAAIDWEDAFTGVAKTVDASDADLSSLADNLREMSTTMPTTAIDLAHIAEAAGAMGVGFDEATGKTNTATIAAFTKQVALLAETTDVSADDAATSLGQLTNVLGLGADEFDNFAAALVDLGNKGASTESQILEIAKRSGGAAANIDLAADATLGWASAAANLGINQELAGTSLQNFFLKSQALVGKKGGLQAMADIAGTTAKDFKKAFDKDASGALESFLKGLGKMPKDARLKAVQSLFGKGSGLTRLILGLSDSMDTNLTPALDTSTQAWKDATAAQVEFDKRNATVRSSLARLKNGVIDAAVTVGEGFAPAIGNAASKLAEFLRLPENRQALKDLGTDIGAAIDKVDWKEVLKGAREFVGILKGALGWAERLWTVFNSLPTEVKGAAAGFLALNKLSGGLIGGGIGDIVGGLGSSLAKSLAASIPIFGKAFVQPVFVTNMPLGGLGGGAALPGAGAAAGAAGLGLVAAATALIGVAAAEIGIASILAPDIRRILGVDAATPGGAPTEGQTHTVIDGPVKVNFSTVTQAQERTTAAANATRDKVQALLTKSFENDRGSAAISGKDIDDQTLATAFAGSLDPKIEAVRAAMDRVNTTTSERVDALRTGAVSAIDGAKAATEAGANTVAGAIRNKNLQVQLDNRTTVNVSVSATGVKTSTTYQNRVGKSTGSHGGSGAGVGYSGHAGGH